MRRSSWAQARRSAWSAGTAPASRRSSRSSSASPPRSCAIGATSGSWGPSGSSRRRPWPGVSDSNRPGFSHILSARGLDVLDEAVGAARKAMADDPSAENIELFTDLQEKFQSNGGYEAESVMARLADGLGLRQELLLEDIESLSGGQRRRVDLMRVLFQEPELMILDEPTNHLDRSAKRWLLDELERFPGAILVVSHDLKLLDRSISKVLHISNQRLTEWKGNYSKFEAQHEADQSQRERAAALEKREITRLVHLGRLHARPDGQAGQGRQVTGQAGRAHRRTAHPGRQAGEGQQVPPPDAAALRGRPARGLQAVGGATARTRSSSNVQFPCQPGRPRRHHRPQRRRASRVCCGAWPASRSRRTV